MLYQVTNSFDLNLDSLESKTFENSLLSNIIENKLSGYCKFFVLLL